MLVGRIDEGREGEGGVQPLIDKFTSTQLHTHPSKAVVDTQVGSPSSGITQAQMETVDPPAWMLQHLQHRRNRQQQRRSLKRDLPPSNAEGATAAPSNPPAPSFAFPDVFTVPSAKPAEPSALQGGCSVEEVSPCCAEAEGTEGQVSGFEAEFQTLRLQRELARDGGDISRYTDSLLSLASRAGLLYPTPTPEGEPSSADSLESLRVRLLDAISLTLLQEDGLDGTLSLPAPPAPSSGTRVKRRKQQQQRCTSKLLLKELGYLYRLSDPILRYSLEEPALPSGGVSADDMKRLQEHVVCYDKALPPNLFSRVKHCFRSGSPFWKEHGYEVGKTPYFSYRHSLRCGLDAELRREGRGGKGWEGYSVMDLLASHVARLMQKDIPRAKEAKFVEWWAHCRPHTHAHQLHFDADNEGKGGVRNPLANCIIFLSGDTGGPTLVTTQRHGASKLSQDGWLVYPKENRVVAYPANVLHGVLPGRGVPPGGPEGRRITLMVALWGDSGCTLRPAEKPGASRPFPAASGGAFFTRPDPTPYTWPAEFRLDAALAAEAAPKESPLKVVPPPLPSLWEDVDAAANKKRRESISSLKRIPHYDLCFQGF